LPSKPDELCGFPRTSVWPALCHPLLRIALPEGDLRIGGDSPNGLVLSGGAPAARTVRLLDMETGALIAETTSNGSGVYAFTDLSDRDDGYAVWIVGDSGENGYIIQGVHPGTP
jgi:hypothetical protein